MVYRLILNGKDSGQTITAASKMDAFDDVMVTKAVKSGDTVQLKELD